mmetsp:Transcript_88565/g.249976  ORF Transcript_88565/g.249976 Transcript_88565/m.249976 type:complete len:202 (+) Transcript_88565:104-709(+)
MVTDEDELPCPTQHNRHYRRKLGRLCNLIDQDGLEVEISQYVASGTHRRDANHLGPLKNLLAHLHILLPLLLFVPVLRHGLRHHVRHCLLIFLMHRRFLLLIPFDFGVQFHNLLHGVSRSFPDPRTDLLRRQLLLPSHGDGFRNSLRLLFLTGHYRIQGDLVQVFPEFFGPAQTHGLNASTVQTLGDVVDGDIAVGGGEHW